MVLCTITYANHFYNGFHFDDSHSIQNNSYIRSLGNVPLFFKDGSTSSALPQNQSYRPVTTTSLAFDYWLGGGYNLFFFHLSTFILFLLQGVLMIWFFLRIFNISAPGSKRNTYIALVAVTGYLLHPAIAETVNYIIARADLQSTFFVIFGFALYQHSSICRKYLLYLVPVIIGALAKPPAIMFAPMFLIYLLFFDEKLSLIDVFKKNRFKQVFNVIKKAMPAFVICLFLYWLQGHLTPKTWEAGGTSPKWYLATQPYVVFHYFKMFFVPNALSADSDWQLLTSIWNWHFFVGMAFIILMIVTAFITSKKTHLRPISFGIIWFFLALIPTSSIIPLAEVLNDHRMFFPFVGLCLSVSWTVGLLIKNLSLFSRPAYKTIGVIVLVLILSAYAYGTNQRNEVWHTEETLWHDVTIKSPGNGRGMMNYGLAKMAQGDYVTADVYFKKAQKLLPYYTSLYVNIGILNAATGHYAIAEENFNKGIWYGSNYPDPYVFYGRFLNERGRYREAEVNLQKALQLAPANVYARTLLMDVYQNEDKWSELKELAQATLQIMPGNEDAQKYLQAADNKKDKIAEELELVKKAPTAERYVNLSLRYYNTGKFEECIAACKEAIKLRTNYPEAYNNMGTAYNSLKKYDEAIAALKIAVALKPDFQLAVNNLAVAYRGKKEAK